MHAMPWLVHPCDSWGVCLGRWIPLAPYPLGYVRRATGECRRGNGLSAYEWLVSREQKHTIKWSATCPSVERKMTYSLTYLLTELLKDLFFY